jgi:hypothetical protein
VTSFSHTPSSLVAELLMSRNASHKSFLVLEGPHDRRFWERRIDKAACECALAYAKQTLLLAFQKLDSTGFRGALGIIDADVDHLEGRPPVSPNIVATDTVDLEALLLRSPALESVLLEFGEASKIATFERSAGHDVRTALLHRTLPFGRIRWVSERRKLGIPMDRLSPYKYFEGKSWALLEDRLLHDAAGHTHSLQEADLRAEIDALPAHDPWQVVHGKDMLKILDQGLRGALGARDSKSHAEHVARLLRQGIDGAELHRTSVGVGIAAWERRNPPFVVLPRSAA